MFYETITQMKKQLGQLDGWLAAAKAFATEKKFDADVFLTLRLAPDQFAFVRQVQGTCDTAKLAATRLAGREAPSHPDTETTLNELRTRIASVIELLGTFDAKDFSGAAERSITQARWEGKTLSGADYFMQHAVPNFFFHLTHAYAILRHAGVPIGKRDYLGPMPFRPPAG
jgi:uncharacterized protein